MRILLLLLSFLSFSSFSPLLGETPLSLSQEPEELIIYNRILAKVNGKTISQIDVMKKMDLFLQKHYPHLTSSKIARYQFYSTQWKETLSQMVDQELMIADAEHLEIKLTEAEVREEMLSRFGPNMMPLLDKMGLTYLEAKSMIRDEMLVQRILWFRVNSKALSSVNSADVKQAYQEFCEKHPELEEWQYQVLSLRSSQEENSKAIAERAATLLESGISLEEAATQLSTAEEGVSINLSSEMQADEKTISSSHKEALKNLGENTFSAPLAQVSRIDHSVVYRIFYLKKHSKKSLPSFEKMAEDIKDQLLQQAANRENVQYIQKLRKRLGYDEKQMLETLPSDFQPFAMR